MSGSDSMRQLVSQVGHHIARNIIQAQVVYPKTASLSDKAVVTLEYSKSSPLAMAIKELHSKIELQAIDAVKDAVEVLTLIEEFKESLLVDQADTIVIYKGGFDVIKLKNSENPESGRSIYVELNSCRNELIRYIQTARGKGFPWLEVGIAVGVFVTAVLVVSREFKK